MAIAAAQMVLNRKVAAAAESDGSGAVADHTERWRSLGKVSTAEIADHSFRTSG